MRVILVARPETVEMLINQSESGFSGGAKKLAFGAAAVAAGATAPAWAGATLLGASALAAKKYGLSKEGVKEGLRDATTLANTLLSIKDKPELDLEEKLNKLSLNLNLPVSITYVPLDQAGSLELGIGGIPVDGSFYISHPILENVFIRPAEYTAVLAKEKEAAFMNLASALGAKTIRLESFYIKESGGFFGSKVKPNILAQQIGINARFDSKGQLEKNIYKEFNKPKFSPHVPDEIQQWTKIDPDLRQLAKDRLTNNLSNINVKLSFKEVNTGGAQIALALAGKKLNIGGEYQTINESSWDFSVEFYEDEFIIS